MLSKTIIFAAIAASLAFVPATRATADSRDFIAGAIIGGIGGAIINNEVRKNKARQAARSRAVAPRTTTTTQRAYRAPAQKTYRPSIPATPEGREIQSSLNYFGFDAGSIDGKVGSKTRSAIADYQRYMGYEGTGTLTSFQQHLLTSAYFRAEAGGNRTFQDIASHPDGTRGLLKIYRDDLAAGSTQQRSVRPEPSSATTEFTDLKVTEQVGRRCDAAPRHPALRLRAVAAYNFVMPYRWTSEPDAKVQELHLWPHNSLPQKGMAAFVLATFTLILIPALPLLGSVVLWGLLPFVLGAVWAMYYALRRNRRARQIIEVLTLDADETHLTRTDANGQVREWDCNRYWTQVTKYEDQGPVPHYVTLKGKGREVEIGAFLSEEERSALYDDLTRALRR